jgi:hypothetical protein
MMKESSIESRIRDRTTQKRRPLAENRGGLLFFCCGPSGTTRRSDGDGKTTPFEGIEALWMTGYGSERIFLADGPGLLRLQGRGYRVLRLVSR